MKRLEYMGIVSGLLQWRGGVNRTYKSVAVLFEQYWRDDQGNEFGHIKLDCKPYSQEEQEEIDMYGDPEHEAYLMSEDYEDDCRSEKWAWLKDA